ncbi:glyoxalase, partial [Streptomyces sp. FT05W]
MPQPQMIFVNLPVKDLGTTKNFFAKLGFGFNPQFSDETTACLVISDTIFAMLITEPRFKDFTRKEIADASRTTEVLIALSADSREKVDELADAALA